jgi:hypothetical protein
MRRGPGATSGSPMILASGGALDPFERRTALRASGAYSLSGVSAFHAAAPRLLSSIFIAEV